MSRSALDISMMRRLFLLSLAFRYVLCQYEPEFFISNFADSIRVVQVCNYTEYPSSRDALPLYTYGMRRDVIISDKGWLALASCSNHSEDIFRKPIYHTTAKYAHSYWIDRSTATYFTTRYERIETVPTTSAPTTTTRAPTPTMSANADTSSATTLTTFGTPICPTNPLDRQECGYLGIGQTQCLNNGCCWNPISYRPNGTFIDVPWCFWKTNTGKGSSITGAAPNRYCPFSYISDQDMYGVEVPGVGYFGTRFCSTGRDPYYGEWPDISPNPRPIYKDFEPLAAGGFYLNPVFFRASGNFSYPVYNSLDIACPTDIRSVAVKYGLEKPLAYSRKYLDSKGEWQADQCCCKEHEFHNTSSIDTRLGCVCPVNSPTAFRSLTNTPVQMLPEGYIFTSRQIKSTPVLPDCPPPFPSWRERGVCVYAAEPMLFGDYGNYSVRALSFAPPGPGSSVFTENEWSLDSIGRRFPSEPFYGYKNFTVRISSHAILSVDPMSGNLTGPAYLSAYQTAASTRIDVSCDNATCKVQAPLLSSFSIPMAPLGDPTLRPLRLISYTANIYAPTVWTQKFLTWSSYSLQRYVLPSWVSGVIVVIALLLAGCYLRMWFALLFSDHLKAIPRRAKIWRAFFGGALYFLVLIPGSIDIMGAATLLVFNLLLAPFSRMIMFFPISSYLTRKLFKKYKVVSMVWKPTIKVVWPRDRRMPWWRTFMIFTPFLLSIVSCSTLGSLSSARRFTATKTTTGDTARYTIDETITIPATRGFHFEYTAVDSSGGMVFTGGVKVSKDTSVPALCDYSYSGLPYKAEQYTYHSNFNEYCECAKQHIGSRCWFWENCRMAENCPSGFSEPAELPYARGTTRCDSSDTDNIGVPSDWSTKVCGGTAIYARLLDLGALGRGSELAFCSAVPVATRDRVDVYKCANSPASITVTVYQKGSNGALIYEDTFTVTSTEVVETDNLKLTVDATDMQVQLPPFVGVMYMPSAAPEILGDLTPFNSLDASFAKFVGVPSAGISVAANVDVSVSGLGCKFGSPQTLDPGRIRANFPSLTARTKCIHAITKADDTIVSGYRRVGEPGIPFIPYAEGCTGNDCVAFSANMPTLEMESYNCDSYLKISLKTSADVYVSADIDYIDAKSVACSTCVGFWGSQGASCSCTFSTAGVFSTKPSAVTSTPLAIVVDAPGSVDIRFTFANPYSAQWESTQGGYVLLPMGDLKDPPFVTPCTDCDAGGDDGTIEDPPVADNWWDTWGWIVLTVLIISAPFVFVVLFCCILPKCLQAGITNVNSIDPNVYKALVAGAKMA